jgi:cytochrome c55X
MNKLFFMLFLASTAVVGRAAPEMPAEPDAGRQKELVRMVRQDCGSCHGMTLKGGLGPALLPADLQGKSTDGLVATIYYGRPGTPMPPWQPFMTEAEAGWIVEKLISGFPN